jgi:succinoglycan biosynthesis protein ExoA
VGGFDPTMAHGEDEEVNWRLRKAGHRIVLDDRIRFTYVTRPDWPSAYRQYRNYGRARVRVVRRHPGFLRAHHLVPGAAVATGLGLMLASPFSRIARRTFGGLCLAYGAVGAAAALVANRRPSEAALVAAAFPALHGGYGVGMLLGIADLARTTGEARRSGATSGEEGDERTLQSG